MPGLIRGVARTAVIAGTATHVSNNVSRRQQQKWSDREQQAQANAYAQQQYAQAQMQQAPPQGYPQQPVAYAQPEQYAPPPAPAAPVAPPVDLVAEIQKLVELRNSGALSEAEFEVAKARVLAG
jgi:hypothetical protein